MALYETFTYDDTGTAPFILSGFPVIAEQETLLAGQNLAAGAVVGIITASGKVTLSDPDMASPDGSENPVGILAADVDATTADAPCVVLKSGLFATDKLVRHVNMTDAKLKAAWEGKPLFIRTPQVLQS